MSRFVQLSDSLSNDLWAAVTSQPPVLNPITALALRKALEVSTDALPAAPASPWANQTPLPTGPRPDADALAWGRQMVKDGSTPEFAFDTVKARWEKDGHAPLALSFDVADLGTFIYPPLKAVQGLVDAQGHPYPEGHVRSESDMIFQPKGMQYDAPPDGWPKASYLQTPGDGRVFFATSSQGRGYFIDKTVADALQPAVAPGWADWTARMKDRASEAHGVVPPGVPPTDPVGDPVIAEG